ncbi:MAG: hypothetical protein NC831_09610, partial [Candidatus Omnitrophica bacterium]|nr:hypothetical protein [Candidatus Omnitrophota bacterium]
FCVCNRLMAIHFLKKMNEVGFLKSPYIPFSFTSPFHKGGLQGDFRILPPFLKGDGRGILEMSNNWKISPRPSLRKRGEKISPFEKGGQKGDFQKQFPPFLKGDGRGILEMSNN